MDATTQNRIAEAILGTVFTALLVSYGWVIESNQAIGFGHGRPWWHVVSVDDPGLVNIFAVSVFFMAAIFAGLMTKRLGLNAFWSLAIAAVVFLHPVPYLLFQ
jgi:hypothetical protein